MKSESVEGCLTSTKEKLTNLPQLSLMTKRTVKQEKERIPDPGIKKEQLRTDLDKKRPSPRRPETKCQVDNLSLIGN